MESLLANFSLLGVSALAVAIVVAVSLTRRTLEFFVPALRAVEKHVTIDGVVQRTVTYKGQLGRFYNELALYLLPYAYAALFAWPTVSLVYGELAAYWDKFFFGFFVATFSGLIYKALKKVVPKLFGVEVDDTAVVLPAD